MVLHHIKPDFELLQYKTIARRESTKASHTLLLSIFQNLSRSLSSFPIVLSILEFRGIPGTPYLIHERAGGECYCLLMAGLARVVAPDRYYGIKG